MDENSRPIERSWTPGRMAFQLTEEYEDYVLTHSSSYTKSGAALAAETFALGEPAAMMLAKEQYPLFGFLTRVLGCSRALDVGTFTGFSALAFAEAVGSRGKVVTIERSSRWAEIARRHWRKAGVTGRVDARHGEAGEVLQELAAAGERFDIVFVDVDKARIQTYFEAVLGLLEPHGLIMIDNTLWHGWVLDEHRTDADTAGMREFNERLVADPRVEAVMVPIGDGVTLIRRRD